MQKSQAIKLINGLMADIEHQTIEHQTVVCKVCGIPRSGEI